MRTTLFILGALVVACTIAAPIESSSITAGAQGPHSERILGGFADKLKCLAQCNPVSKGAFATAFAAAVAAPVIKSRCQPMSISEWQRVKCEFPPSFRHTRVCAPAVWGGVLGKIINARGMALKTKILIRNGITRAYLFNTSDGRKLLRHELQHIRQQSGVPALKWGYRYISGYCRAGCSYKNNFYEVDARRYEYDCPQGH